MSTYATALKAYLDRAENKEADLAAVIEKTQPAVNRYRKGERFPDAATARLIDEATNGEVPFTLWQTEFLTRSGIGEAA
jgi:transcriptional regulator with XRE-family HTH domain